LLRFGQDGVFGIGLAIGVAHTVSPCRRIGSGMLCAAILPQILEEMQEIPRT